MTTQVTISADEACKLLNIHRATLYEKARAGEIPGAKIGRGWVFIEVDLIQYIREQYKVKDHEREKCPSISNQALRAGLS